MQAAVAEFAAVGFDLASIQKIIKASGIPRGSFYQYFEDKEDLYGEVMYVISCRKLEHMKPLLDRQQEFGVFDWLKELVKAGVDFAVRDPEAFRIGKDLYSSKTLNKEIFLKEMQEKLYARHAISPEVLFMQAIQVSFERGEIRREFPLEMVLVFIQGMMEKMSEWYWLHITRTGELESGDKLLDQIISMLKHGICHTNQPE